MQLQIQKGGVGKTTTSINLAASIAEMGKRVLAIDLDPQGNMTSGLGVDKNEVENTVYELMLDECSINESIQDTVVKGLRHDSIQCKSGRCGNRIIRNK